MRLVRLDTATMATFVGVDSWPGRAPIPASRSSDDVKCGLDRRSGPTAELDGTSYGVEDFPDRGRSAVSSRDMTRFPLVLFQNFRLERGPGGMTAADEGSRAVPIPMECKSTRPGSPPFPNFSFTFRYAARVRNTATVCEGERAHVGETRRSRAYAQARARTHAVQPDAHQECAKHGATQDTQDDTCRPHAGFGGLVHGSHGVRGYAAGPKLDVIQRPGATRGGRESKLRTPPKAIQSRQRGWHNDGDQLPTG